MARSKFSEAKLKDPRDILTGMLKATSGTGVSQASRVSLFYRRIAFKGADIGVGCSTLVANVAVCLAKLGLHVLVIDTSILHPIQDILLNTSVREEYDGETVSDWFDLPYTKNSVVNISKVDRNISVLGFSAKKNTVVDMLGMKDNRELLDMALQKLEKQNDIILFDLCDEVTEINTYCMQTAQRVIQVWSNTRGCVENMDRTITNNVLLSCQMDKMRNVVECKMVNDTMGSLSALYKEYRFERIAKCSLSYEVARLASLGKTLFQYATTDEDVVEYTECVLDVCSVICNIEHDQVRGTITSEDITEGRVEGTIHYDMKHAKTVDVMKPESLDDEEFEEENAKRGFSFKRKRG